MAHRKKSREDKGKNKGKAEGRKSREISMNVFYFLTNSSLSFPLLFPLSSLMK
jgi:hypothetical protein